jgi:hypothetical protein
MLRSWSRHCALVVLVFLAACGGGGGGDAGPSVPAPNASTGQAAVGAPMSNAALVFLSLTNGARMQGMADAQGNFMVPAELRPPVLVKATSANSAFAYFGYLREQGQHVAVNPVSTTLIAVAADRHPSSVAAPLTDQQLATGRAAVATAFGRVLAATNVSAATDFLAARFATNHTGLDLVLDSIGAQLNADGSVLLTNKISGARQTVRAGSVAPLPFDANTAAQMNALPIALCAGTLDGLGSQALATETRAYGATFLDSGRSLSTYMALMASAGAGAAFTLAMPVFIGVDANGNLAFSAMQVNTASGQYISDTVLTVNRNADGRCVIVGNRYPFQVSVQPAIKQLIRVDGLKGLANNEVVPAVNGLEIQVGAPDNASAVNTTTGAPDGQQIRSARVDLCAPDGTCVKLATLRSQNKPTNRGTLRIDGSPYAFMDMMPAPQLELVTGLANPVRITFFGSDAAPEAPDDDTGRVDAPLFAKVPGAMFTPAEFAAVAMPSVRNPQYLQSFEDRPSVEFDAGSSTLGAAVFLATAPNQPLKSVRVTVLQPGTGSITAPASADYRDASYRSLTLGARIPSRAGTIQTKYLWAPGSPGSY